MATGTKRANKQPAESAIGSGQPNGSTDGGNTPPASGNDGGASPSIGGLPVTDPGRNDDSPANATGSDGPRKRGRKPGTKNSTQKAANPVTVTGLEKVLYAIHATAASALKAPELELDQTEARNLAEAVAEVQRHYNAVIDPKMMAWIGLFGVAGTIYGPRVAAMRIRKGMEKQMRALQPRPVPNPPPTASPEPVRAPAPAPVAAESSFGGMVLPEAPGTF